MTRPSDRLEARVQRAVHDAGGALVERHRGSERLDRDDAAELARPAVSAPSIATRCWTIPATSTGAPRRSERSATAARADAPALPATVETTTSVRPERTGPAACLSAAVNGVTARTNGCRSSRAASALERRVVAAHELAVLRHVADDLDAGRVHGVDPRVLQRSHVLDDGQAGRPCAGGGTTGLVVE